jgi:uncharacterized spore protein YtfJ
MHMNVDERAELVDDLLERVVETVGRGAHVSAVFGEPVVRGRLTVVPVARARFGIGGGGGSGRRQAEAGSGKGAGGGASVTPVGFIEVRDDGAGFRRIWGWTDLAAVAAAAALVALTLRRLLG